MRLIFASGLAFGVAALAGLAFLPARPQRQTPIDIATSASPIPSTNSGARVTYPAGRYPLVTMPDGRPRAVRSLLNIAHPMRFGEYVWNADGVAAGPVWIRVDLALQTLSVFRDGQEIGSTVILYGADSKPTPAGVYPVLEKAVRHRSTLYDAEMPYMLRLTRDGVAIHASDVRASAATHGCIGVPLAFAQRLFGAVKRGDQVAIMAPSTTA